MDATGNAVPVTQYYGCWVVDFYHKWRTHLSLDKDAPARQKRSIDVRVGIFAHVGASRTFVEPRGLAEILGIP
jgi:hypothetical protein